jgi:WD40 repeat protein
MLIVLGDMANSAAHRAQQRKIHGFLGLPDRLRYVDTDFDEPRVEGSCEWLVKIQKFRTWRDTSSPAIFLLYGNPGSGKSFITHFVYHHLSELSYDCSYYFFKAGDKLQSALASCLLSLASQMATSNSVIRDIFSEMQEDIVHFDRDNFQSIWRHLFVGGIFQTKPLRSHFLVLDALDECANSIDLLLLFSRIPANFPLKIFLSGRPNPEIQSSVRTLQLSTCEQQILPEHTMQDIAKYVENHTDFPTLGKSSSNYDLISTIQTKSDGCFLWVKLVLKELRKVHTVETTRQILEDVPKGMDQIYTRSLEPMSKEVYAKPLAKAILMWAVCSVQSITVKILQYALEMHIKDTIHNLERRISWLCGYLVILGPQSQIRMMHQTARSFLLDPENGSEFAFEEGHGHTQLARVCLQYLCSDELKAPQTRRSNVKYPLIQRSPFLEYAATSFYEHLRRSKLYDETVLELLYSFCTSPQRNILSWMEYIAKSGDLSHITKAGMAIQVYLRACASDKFGVNKTPVIRSWGTDLIRIVAKFGPNLVRFPPAIHFIIPPFCPVDSAPYQQYGRSARGLAVEGLSQKTWDDCLATIVYRERRSRAICVTAAGRHFAIGSSSRTVRLHDTTTCQEYGILEHGEAVRIVDFNFSGQMIASAGNKRLCVWDVTDRKLLWSVQLLSPPLALWFKPGNESVMVACQDNNLYHFDLTDEQDVTRNAWYMDYDHARDITIVPVAGAISIEHKLFAFVYRGGHINLWNWEYSEFVGSCEKPLARQQACPFHASSLVFSPVPNSNSLAAAYEQGEILVFDPLEGNIKASYKADTDNQVLACSPDGRTLISGDSCGMIRIFDFANLDSSDKKLHLLYVIRGHEDNIGALSFCNDTKFVDIRGPRVNVWEPAVLVREDTAASDISTLHANEEESLQGEEDHPITAIAISPSGKHVLCGTEAGAVLIFELTSGLKKQKLYDHGYGDCIVQLQFGSGSIMASADVSSKVYVRQITQKGSKWVIERTLFECRMREPIEQLLFSPNFSHILIATTLGDLVYSFATKKRNKLSWKTRIPGAWCNHPRNPAQLLLFVRTTLRIYQWESLEEITSEDGIMLDCELPVNLDISKACPCWNGVAMLCEYSELLHARTRATLLFLPTEQLEPTAESIRPLPALQSMGNRIAELIGTFGMVLGMSRHSFLFLDYDGWICSVDMDLLPPENYKRHFFLPYEWLSSNDVLIAAVTPNREFVFPRGGELAVIRRGLDFSTNAEPLE